MPGTAWGLIAALGMLVAAPAILRVIGLLDSSDGSRLPLFSSLSAWSKSGNTWKLVVAGIVFLLQIVGLLPLLVFVAGVVGAIFGILFGAIRLLHLRFWPFSFLLAKYDKLVHGISPEDTSPVEPPPPVREVAPLPGLDETAFLQRLDTAWHRLQDAWCAQDLRPVATLLTDGLAAKLGAQLAIQVRAGYRDRLDGKKILSSSIQDTEPGTVYSTVTVRIEATAEDHDIDLRSGEVLEGRSVSGRFVEYWTFLKAHDAAPPSRGLLEGNCPCCGVSLTPEAPATCLSCGSWIRSGKHDWILSEITQDMARGDTSPEGVLSPLADGDPDISRQAIEDTASWAYWRLVRAWNENRTDLAPAAATDPLLQEFQDRIHAVSPGRLLDPIVSSVVLAKAWKEEARDVVEVRVRWNPGPSMKGSRGDIQLPTLRLSRPAGSRTKLGTALTAGHCPSCGGPETDPTAVACAWCASPIGSSSRSWKVFAVEGSENFSGL